MSSDENWLDDKGDEWRDMDDTCCCLYPEPPECDVCRGNGTLLVARARA